MSIIFSQFECLKFTVYQSVSEKHCLTGSLVDCVGSIW